MALSKQEVEVTGIDAVVAALQADGLAPRPADATPGVDLWVVNSRGVCVPLQVMAASKTGFGIHVRYGQIAGVVLIWVWHLDSPSPKEFHAMRWPEALRLAEQLGWTRTGSWERLRYYVQTKASARVTEALRPYRMARGDWLKLIG